MEADAAHAGEVTLARCIVAASEQCAVHRHGLGRVFDAGGCTQPVVGAQRIGRVDMAAGVAGNVLSGPVTHAVEQAHAALMGNARSDPVAVQHGVTSIRSCMGGRFLQQFSGNKILVGLTQGNRFQEKGALNCLLVFQISLKAFHYIFANQELPKILEIWQTFQKEREFGLADAVEASGLLAKYPEIAANSVFSFSRRGWGAGVGCQRAQKASRSRT